MTLFLRHGGRMVREEAGQGGTAGQVLAQPDPAGELWSRSYPSSLAQLEARGLELRLPHHLGFD